MLQTIGKKQIIFFSRHEMAPIATYVFFDLETTGLPSEENNRTKITELSMVAVKRQHILMTRPGRTPRVQNKITLCLCPRKLIQPSCTEVTGLCNNLLENEAPFDMDVYNILNTFLNLLTKPVCLVAQNGLMFDFPILKAHLDRLKVSFNEDLMCADCYHCFYDVEQKKKNLSVESIAACSNFENGNETFSIQPLELTECVQENKNSEKDETDLSNSMRNVNETTPKKSSGISVPETPRKAKARPKEISKVCRRFPWSEGEKPKESYKLNKIRERFLNSPAADAHRAENDCIFALECCVAVAKEFIEWIDENYCKFSVVKAMAPGYSIGLLLLTGMLWGCTNPFIRKGTKGLRSVQAETKFGQAYAEIAFLLGNWKYVVPFVINQTGSLAYLLVVQRAPLSLVVPVANSLAFAFTAITGASIGAEEPLDKGSILGVVLIGVGTTLCCWDKTD